MGHILLNESIVFLSLEFGEEEKAWTSLVVWVPASVPQVWYPKPLMKTATTSLCTPAYQIDPF